MKIAFVFPGQGSQFVGMLDAWRGHAAVADTVAAASAVLKQDLATLIAQGPADQLNLTANTQPVMLTATMAIYAAWRAAGGPPPAVVAGHSLGEYAALTAAQALRFEDAVSLVRIRAEAMQAAVPVGQGAMAAVLGLEANKVLALCQHVTAVAAASERVEAVNFNALDQVVIAGHKGAVEQACQVAKQHGAKRALLLSVSAPFHSSLLQPAAATLAAALANVRVSTPCIPVINNVDVAQEMEPAAICDALVRQAWHPVRWVETILAMKAQGVTHIIECGSGNVLSNLTKRIDPELHRLAITDPESLQVALDVIGSSFKKE